MPPILYFDFPGVAIPGIDLEDDAGTLGELAEPIDDSGTRSRFQSSSPEAAVPGAPLAFCGRSSLLSESAWAPPPAVPGAPLGEGVPVAGPPVTGGERKNWSSLVCLALGDPDGPRGLEAVASTGAGGGLLDAVPGAPLTRAIASAKAWATASGVRSGPRLPLGVGGTE